MNRRLLRLLLALYPRDWRERYGTEVGDLAEDLISTGRRTPWRSGVDLFAGAVAARAHAVASAPAAVIASVLTAGSAAALVIAGYRHGDSTGAVKPYFETSPAGWVLLVVVLAWMLAEFVQLLRVQEHPRGEVLRARTTVWRPLSTTALVVANGWMYIAPSVVPAAAIRPGIVAFAVGLVVLLAGLTLRVWSFHALGDEFSYSVEVRPGQRVVASGPYRAIRHPACAGGLLAYLGLGLMSANWVGVAAMVVLPLVFAIWRIRLEEAFLRANLDDRYRAYAAESRRLIPGVW